MTKDKEESLEQYDEPSLEDFLEDEIDEEDVKRKQRRRKFIKLSAVIISLLLVFQVVGSLFNMFNLDAIQFLKTSYQLSQQEDIQKYKQAVVTIQGDRSKGTGFSISDHGLIITNEHVIRDQRSITVGFPNGDVYEGKIIKAFTDIDIALLQVDGQNLPKLSLSQSNGTVDESIFVIGNPLSFTQIANEGVILKNEDKEDKITVISAPIYKGNSGSPVIDMNGEVVGVVYAKRRVPGSSSVGLAVPIEDVVKQIPSQLINEK